MSKRRLEDEELYSNTTKRPRTLDIVPGELRTFDEPPLPYSQYTIAWICALPLELAASRAMLDEEHQSLPGLRGDDNTYVLGRIGHHGVVMVCLPGEYGNNNAAIVGQDLKRTFPNIRGSLMVGIGGGAPGEADVRLGDVVVGTRVMQYDMGKEVGVGRFEITGIPKIPSRLLLSAATALRAKHESDSSSGQMATFLQSRLSDFSPPDDLDRLFQASYEHPPNTPTCDECDQEKLESRRRRIFDKPKIHHGVVASGNRVMKHGIPRDDIAHRLSALCFEMESAGIMDNLECLPIRGICDYSDSHKNKKWQRYAAATAAAYARELLEALPAEREERGYTTTSSSRAIGSNTDEASERRQRLLESLSFQQIDDRKRSIQHAYAKTCQWLLRHKKYRNWLDSMHDSDSDGFLWIRGKAGAGKSTMMKFAYLETKKSTKKNHSIAVASFFFHARGDYLEKSVTGMYRSLLSQLLKAFPDLLHVLDDDEIVPPEQQACPDLNALKGLLRSAVLSLDQRSFICFIDALDECDEQEVRDMVLFFEDLAGTTADNDIRICFSSRPYPYIEIRPEVALTIEDEIGHAEDLAQYVQSQLKVTDIELKDQILDKAAGIFMWVVLVVPILNQESSYGKLALRRRLAEIPSKLSDLFKSILMRDRERMEWFQLGILWILCAKRPLSPEEFRHAVWAGLLEQKQVDPDLPRGTDMDASKLVTSSTKGLAEVTTKSKQPTVQFIHESVRDFLVKENGLRELWPDLGHEWEGRGHERLKCCCATYLSLKGLQSSVGKPKDYDEKYAHAVAEKYSLFRYASQHILHHANAAALVASQDDFLRQFLTATGYRLLNTFEKFEARRYDSGDSSLYILAHRGLGDLIRTCRDSVSPLIEGHEPLFAALENGHRDAVAALLGLSSVVHNGIDIMAGLQSKKDVVRHTGRTPLSWAAQEGRLGMVQVLLQRGANVNEVDKKGYTPILRASENGHEPVVRLLIDKGADIHAKNNLKSEITALMYASQQGHEAVVRLLIEKGADIHAQDCITRTALCIASREGHESVARLLIEKGADTYAKNKWGTRALLSASQVGHEPVVRLLIEMGADTHTQCPYKRTILTWASIHGHGTVVRLLIEKGEDIHARDKFGKTALVYASSRGDEAVARLLIDKGAEIHVLDNEGKTALIWASVRGYEHVVRLLIDNGANIHAQDNGGRTALFWASEKGHEAVARLLEACETAN